jgi:hypothetical protein
MKNLTFLLIGLLLFTACNEDEEAQPQPGPLESSGILGNWEIQFRSYNNISDASALCCEFLLFEEDENQSDLKGKMISTSTGSVTEWEFIMDVENSRITFNRENNTREYEYAINDGSLSFEYMEDSTTVKRSVLVIPILKVIRLQSYDK